MTKTTRTRRALCLLLAICALFAVLPQPVMAADKAVRYADGEFISAYATESVAKAHTYNVMHGSVIDGRYVFRPLDYVTRQEMFRVVYSLGNAGKTDRNEMFEWLTEMSAFVDKNEIAAWAKSYAGYCISMGLFVGDGSNRLKPRDHITYFECAIVFLRVLGYTQNTLAIRSDETQEQWRSRVIAEADRLGLFANVLYYENGRYDQAIFRQDVAVMVANALKCKVVTHFLVLDEVVYVERDETLAEYVFGKVEETRSTVVGISDGKYLLDNGLTIATYDFKEPVEALLGRQIVYNAAPANLALSWTGSLAAETVTVVTANKLQCTLKNRRIELQIGNAKYAYTVSPDDSIFLFDGGKAGTAVPVSQLPALVATWQSMQSQIMLRMIVGEDETLRSVRVIYLAQ